MAELKKYRGEAKKKGTTVFLAAITVLISFIPVSAAAITTVSIQDVSIGEGESTIVPIMINDVVDVKGAYFLLSYDPAVVHVEDIGSSDLNFETYEDINNSAGFTRYAVMHVTANMSGLSGAVKFADVALTAVGTAGASSPLTIDAVCMLDSGSEEIRPRDVNNGTFSINGTPYTPPNDNVTVGIPSSSAAPGDTAIVPITVYNVTDLGAGTLTVTYDPEVCAVTDVTTGDFYTVTKNITVSGIAILSTMGTQGHTGDIAFANLEIKAIGSCGETSHLDLTVETLKTYGPPVETIPPAAIRVSNGIFSIVDEVAPSVTNPSATPATILNDNGRPRIPGTNRAQLNVTVTDTIGIDTVTIDVSPIGGSSAEEMTNIAGTDIWTVTVNAPAGINHTHNLVVTATDTSGNSDTSVSIPLTVLRRGDVLRDDVVDIGDALYLLQWTTGDVSDPGVLVGDVNPATGDGVVDVGDALYLLQWTTREAPEP